MISVIVPTLNRGHLIRTVSGEIASVLDELARPYEIIFVDDGSQDDTAAVLGKLCAVNSYIRGLVLVKNSGQQNATLAGIRAARYPYVLTMDDDLEYDVQGIREIVQGLDAGYEAVYIVSSSPDTPLPRQWGTTLKEFVFQAFCHKPPQIRLTSYRGMQKSIADYVAQDPVQNVYISARLLQRTVHILNVFKDYAPAQRKPSNYSSWILIRLLWHVIRNYAEIPGLKGFRQTGEQYRVKETLPCD